MAYIYTIYNIPSLCVTEVPGEYVGEDADVAASGCGGGLWFMKIESWSEVKYWKKNRVVDFCVLFKHSKYCIMQLQY